MARRHVQAWNRWLVGTALAACLATACTTVPSGSDAPTPTSSSPISDESSPTAGTASATPTTSPTPGTDSAAPTPAQAPTPTRPPKPKFDVRDVLDDIETLAGDIGPREATSKRFREAADLVSKRFRALGYEVSTESVKVPAGNSWGTPVKAGTSRNVVADPPGFDDRKPHMVVVAHLDTVAVAPGAEDNASGIAVMLELARMAAAAPPKTPVRFIAFGAEEPRGTGDALHHFGSQQHVAKLSKTERKAIVAAVALDRVGVRASYVPVCSARSSGDKLRSQVRAAAKKVDVPTRSCSGNTTSDHWSYAKAGIPAIRLGSIPYAGYHSPADTPEVVDRRQLSRVGAVMWAWLQRS